MLIDQIKIKNKRGMGWIVFMAFLILFALPAAVMAIRRFRNIELRHVPQVRLFGKIPFGNVLPWGFLLVASGTMLTTAFLTMETLHAAEYCMLLFVTIPQLLTGIVLTIYFAYYRAYKTVADLLLQQVANKPNQNFTLEPIAIQGFKFDNDQILRILYDLCNNDLIALQELPNGEVSAWIIAPELLTYLKNARDARNQSQSTYFWTCLCCGAPNTTPPEGTCAYCGASDKKK